MLVQGCNPRLWRPSKTGNRSCLPSKTVHGLMIGCGPNGMGSRLWSNRSAWRRRQSHNAPIWRSPHGLYLLCRSTKPTRRRLAAHGHGQQGPLRTAQDENNPHRRLAGGRELVGRRGGIGAGMRAGRRAGGSKW